MKITLANGTVLEMDDAPTPKPETKDAPAPATKTAPAKPKQADAVTPKPPAAKRNLKRLSQPARQYLQHPAPKRSPRPVRNNPRSR